MARRTDFLIGVLLLLGVPGLALAQDEVGPVDLTRATMDPVEKLVGVWRVDRIDGSAPADSLRGRVLRIDRQSVATLTRGSCSNPSFAEQLGSITVTCLGQDLAIAAWNPQEPGTLQWSEGGLQAVLHRLSGTEALDSPPAAAADAVPEDDEPTEDAQ
ncbi:hypothetical protein [Dongia sedimenti]|uniref:Protease inhibitor Inh n=1 Tax=Dongia sedimenti TaxID=3064282 RepID=A0ABU0YKR7_9PROT|nr:hypothetical protein [Rhodospirillaceae bacterium R-7]